MLFNGFNKNSEVLILGDEAEGMDAAAQIMLHDLNSFIVIENRTKTRFDYCLDSLKEQGFKIMYLETGHLASETFTFNPFEHMTDNNGQVIPATVYTLSSLIMGYFFEDLAVVNKWATKILLEAGIASLVEGTMPSARKSFLGLSDILGFWQVEPYDTIDTFIKQLKNKVFADNLARNFKQSIVPNLSKNELCSFLRVLGKRLSSIFVGPLAPLCANSKLLDLGTEKIAVICKHTGENAESFLAEVLYNRINDDRESLNSLKARLYITPEVENSFVEKMVYPTNSQKINNICVIAKETVNFTRCFRNLPRALIPTDYIIYVGGSKNKGSLDFMRDRSCSHSINVAALEKYKCILSIRYDSYVVPKARLIEKVDEHCSLPW